MVRKERRMKEKGKKAEGMGRMKVKKGCRKERKKKIRTQGSIRKRKGRGG